MYNHSDGYSPLFTSIYFSIIIVVGHFYIMQLLLAVIMSNLSKLMAQETHESIQTKKKLVLQDKFLEKQEEEVEELKRDESSMNTQNKISTSDARDRQSSSTP